jgi:hypothetical protein
MNTRYVMGKYAVKNCGKADTEWNYNTKGSDNFLHKSKQQPSSLTSRDKTDCRIMEPKICLLLDPVGE